MRLAQPAAKKRAQSPFHMAGRGFQRNPPPCSLMGAVHQNETRVRESFLVLVLNKKAPRADQVLAQQKRQASFGPQTPFWGGFKFGFLKISKKPNFSFWVGALASSTPLKKNVPPCPKLICGSCRSAPDHAVPLISTRDENSSPRAKGTPLFWEFSIIFKGPGKLA
ncbi:MAG: hypothetical protein CM15mP119_3240 [Alphaproteobacteria bacterium]|nr:MAG: hypothetical protein CM15mP119_3240 [Alphaproteobacteria bacterium]